MDEKENNINDLPQAEVFLRLLVGNQDSIYSFILTMVHNRNDADDLLQDTITVMWRNFSIYQQGTSFVGWGISISKNLILKFFEKHRHSKLTFSSDIEKEIAELTIQKLESFDDRILALRNCVKKLNSRDYDLVQLHYEKKKTIKQIALERAISSYTLYRMMGKIHRLLQNCIYRTISQQELI